MSLHCHCDGLGGRSGRRWMDGHLSRGQEVSSTFPQLKNNLCFDHVFLSNITLCVRAKSTPVPKPLFPLFRVTNIYSILLVLLTKQFTQSTNEKSCSYLSCVSFFVHSWVTPGLGSDTESKNLTVQGGCSRLRGIGYHMAYLFICVV
ncbi:unnamed protein product [Knipowitschia caucasica]